MNALQQLREEMSGAWESLTEGWHKLYRRATAAMTRFTTKRKDGGELTNDERGDIAVRSAGWGLLAAEVFDDHDRVTVRLEAPGMAKDDFQLEVRDDYLLVRGEKRIEREREKQHEHGHQDNQPGTEHRPATTEAERPEPRPGGLVGE